MIAYGQVCPVHTGVHNCCVQTCYTNVPSIVCSTQGCKLCTQQQALYLDQQWVAIAAGFPHQLRWQHQLPAGMSNCEMLAPHHACRSVSIMTDASGFTAWFLSHCLLVFEEQGQHAHLDTKRSCLCRVSNVTGCDDVYTRSKASSCTGAHRVRHSCFNTTVACLFWCLSR